MAISSILIEEDYIKNSILSKKLVIYEDCLRDGAQAKTILSLEQRIKFARACVDLFGEESYKQLVLVLGYPPICIEEAVICKQLAAELPEISVQVVCRANMQEIELCAKTLDKSRHPRILLIIPGSEQISRALTNRSLEECLETTYAKIAEATECYQHIKFDVALADVTRGLSDTVIDFVLKANKIKNFGVFWLPDTVGILNPFETYNYFSEFNARVNQSVAIVAHCHNDFGFALINNISALRAGIYGHGTSFLGLGERCGITHTEQLIFNLANDDLWTEKLIGRKESIWNLKPNLHALSKICYVLAEEVKMKIPITNPIIGPGINSISTGTPFKDRDLFQPYDPLKALNIPPQTLITQMASRHVLRAVLEKNFIELMEEQIEHLLEWVKSELYRKNEAVMEESHFLSYVKNIGKQLS